jgi:hypothetical protein
LEPTTTIACIELVVTWIVDWDQNLQHSVACSRATAANLNRGEQGCRLAVISLNRAVD